jgi:excisionase family DNA binding protein
MDNTLLTVKEAAERLARNPAFVRRLTHDGQLHARRFRGRIYVSAAEIAEFATLVTDTKITDPKSRQSAVPRSLRGVTA